MLMKSREKKIENRLAARRFDLNVDFTIKNEMIFEKKLKNNQHVCDEVRKIYENFTDVWDKEKFKEYEKMLVKNDKLTQDIFENEKKIQNIRRQVRGFKAELAKVKEENSRASVTIRSQYVFLFDDYQELCAEKRKLDKENDRKVGVVAGMASKCNKRLENLLKIACSIEKTWGLCKKHEKLDDLPGFGSEVNFYEENENCEDDVVPWDVQKSVKTASKIDQNCKEIISQSSLNFDNHKEQKSSFQIEESHDQTPLNTMNDETTFMNLFILSLRQSSFAVHTQVEAENVQKREVKLASTSSSSTLVENHEADQTPDDSTTNIPELIPNSPTKHQYNLSDVLKTSDFFMKIAQIEADCIQLQTYKQSLESEQQKLKHMQREQQQSSDVQKNLKKLNLNQSISVGKIGQISHQIPQIVDKMKPKCTKSCVKLK
jgi:hypothetical protein